MFIVASLILQAWYCINVNAIDNDFKIHGVTQTKYNGKIAQICIVNNDTLERISRDTIRNGCFNLQGQSYLDGLSYLYIVDADTTQIVSMILNPILEIGEINIIINDSLPNYHRISGTYLNDEVNLYYDSLRILLKNGTNDETDARSGISKLRHIFFTTHKDDVASQKIFLQNIAANDPLLIDYYNILSERLQQKPDIKRYADDYKRNILAINQVGKIVADYEFIDIEENKMKISNYIGKSDFLFIDFWASWCSPCRASIQDIKKYYQKNKEKGVEVLGVSIDENKDAWIKALHQENMPWKQLVIKTPNEKNIVKEQYKMIGIPFTLLLDRDGYVLFVNLHPRSLESWLDGYIKNQTIN